MNVFNFSFIFVPELIVTFARISAVNVFARYAVNVAVGVPPLLTTIEAPVGVNGRIEPFAPIADP